MYIHFRYITRTVLIPFVDGEHVPATKRADADRHLRKVMDNDASQAVGVIISIGKYLCSDAGSVSLNIVMEDVEAKLPEGTCQRLVTSYSWLLLATFKVSL